MTTFSHLLSGRDRAAFSDDSTLLENNPSRIRRFSFQAKGRFGVWLRRIGCGCLAALGLCGIVERSQAATHMIFPSALYTERGNRSTQSITVLSSQEESGESDGWANYIECYGSPVGYQGRFIFFVPASLLTATTVSGQLAVQYKGATAGEQRWRFEILEQTSGNYLLLGDNSAAQSWIWSPLNFAIPSAAPARFLGSGQIEIRLVTDSPVDDCDIDYVALTLQDTGVVTPPGPTPTPTFVESTDDFLNPERGFLHFSDLSSSTDFAAIRASGASLAYTRVQLNSYRNGPLPQSLLTDLSLAFTKIQAAGLKAVVRFQYDEGGGQDAPVAQVLAHIQQLGPVLRQNSHLIATLQAGFIGAWGEWHTSANGLDHNNAAKSAIVLALLDAVPNRFVQIRTPTHKADIFGSNFPMKDGDAFSAAAWARVGHLNDAFLGSANDMGTYPWDAVDYWRSMVASETRFVPMGGEANNYNPPRSSGATALNELAMLHFSFLNEDYEQQVIDSWQQDGTYPEIRRRLGYRFVLRNVSAPAAVQPGQNLAFTLRLDNVGFAAMYNPRPIYLVLSSAQARYELPLTALDPRRWLPGGTIQLDTQVPIPPTVAPGTYQLSLWLPDPSPALRGDPRYSVRFANDGTWDGTSGRNILGASVTVAATVPTTPPGLQVLREQGLVVLQISGNPGDVCVIEASQNLSDWAVIGTQTLAGSSATFVDPNSLQYARRFYRVRR